MRKEAQQTDTPVKLLNLLDIEHGASLRAEATSVAARVAQELSEGMTQSERIATHEFLTEVANAVRWLRVRLPYDPRPVRDWIRHGPGLAR
jgi:hypothetical protein